MSFGRSGISIAMSDYNTANDLASQLVVDVGPSSPFEPGGAIIGGTDRTISVVARKAGCYKYSAGACMSGAIYGMCGTADAEFIVKGSN